MLGLGIGAVLVLGQPRLLAQVSPRPETEPSQPASGLSDTDLSTACPPPVLTRLTRHTIAAGETLDSIAQKYDLIPATLMGFNPILRGGKTPVGTEIQVPPFNGIRVELQPNQSLREVARKYGVRPDVLFEINGCQKSPRMVFVPGVNWSPIAAKERVPTSQAGRILSASPLPAETTNPVILLKYGWGLQPRTNRVGFHSGLDLAAPAGTPVLAVANGTVAFAGNQGSYGNLVVINHAEGLQTRYAQLEQLKVKTGQTVKRGQEIGIVGTTGRPSSLSTHLHFEVRSRSNLGWVAEDPSPYLFKAPAPTSQK